MRSPPAHVRFGFGQLLIDKAIVDALNHPVGLHAGAQRASLVINRFVLFQRDPLAGVPFRIDVGNVVGRYVNRFLLGDQSGSGNVEHAVDNVRHDGFLSSTAC